MEVLFQENQVKYDDQKFVYEKNVEFDPNESNEWDETESDF